MRKLTESAKPESDAVQDLAREFSRLLRIRLTPEQLAEAVRRNSTLKYRGCCASHDFCDANEYMEAAFLNLGFRAPDGIEEILASDWDSAWELAKQNRFYL